MKTHVFDQRNSGELRGTVPLKAGAWEGNGTGCIYNATSSVPLLSLLRGVNFDPRTNRKQFPCPIVNSMARFGPVAMRIERAEQRTN